MVIWRHKKSGQLYTIAHVKPPKYTGSWHNAMPYKHDGKVLKDIKMEDFERVAEGRYELPPPINLKGLVGK